MTVGRRGSVGTQRGAVSSVVRAADDPTASEIISAAVAAMAEHGYHGTSVRDIAARAGVSPGTLYHHFGSKHALLVLILHRSIEHLVRRTEDALFHAEQTPTARLRAIVEVHVLAHANHRAESFLGNSELRSVAADSRSLIVALRDSQQRMFDRVILDGARAGVFGTPVPIEVSRAIVSACTAVASWYRPEGALSPAEIAGRYQRFALDAACCRERP